MELKNNTILITGGASGIGFALAKRLVKSENKVIIVGRRAAKLEEAKLKYPDLATKVCDLSNEKQRQLLVEELIEEYPQLNIVIHNAGIQNRINLTKIQADWSQYQSEIAINLEAPIHLSMLLIPHLQKKEKAAIINVSSGLGLIPAAWVPIYTATKSALHFFTQAMRMQLENTDIQVFEIFPPAVNTDLGGAGLHTFGVSVDEFADAVIKELEKNTPEIGYGTTLAALANDFTKEAANASGAMVWDKLGKTMPEFKNLF